MPKIRSWLARQSAALRLRRLMEESELRDRLDLPVVFTNDGTYGSNDVLEARVAAALLLVESYQPWRYARLRRDLRLIWLKRLPSFRACYLRELGACVLDTYFVANHTVQEVAASIVHEAVHARLAAVPTPRSVAREERACRRAEVSFGRTLPDGSVVLRRAEAVLDGEDHEVAPSIDWREVARNERHTEIMEAKVPSWVKRLALWKAGLA